VDAARVKAIQSNIRYGLLMGLESPDDVALQLGWYAGIFGTPDALARHLQNVAKIQPEQLVSFAKRYLADSNLTVLTLTPAAGGKP
jgi:zinc protease